MFIKFITPGVGLPGLEPITVSGAWIEYFHSVLSLFQLVETTKMEKNRITGLLGAIILFLGVFAPCLDAGIMRGLSYYQISNSFALVLLALAVVSFVFVLTENLKGLWFTGLGAAVALTYNLLPFFNGTATIQLQGLDDSLFTRAITSALMPVQMRWGCAMLAVGVICIVASAASSNPKSTN